MTTVSKEHIKALDKAKIALMTKPDSVFFCEIAFSLKYKWDESVPTAATDGLSMYINPDYFMGLPPEERLGLIIHESMHVAYMHPARLQGRDHKLYNMAADYVINLVVISRGFKLPSGGLYDTQFTGMSSEQVYDLLVKDKENNPKKYAPRASLFSVMPSIGDANDLKAPPQEMEPEELEKQIEEILIRAAIRSKEENDKPGTIPGDIQVLIDNLLKPKLPTKQILIKYLINFDKNDYSWRKPNRRYPDYYLPSLFSEVLEDIAIAVDISGSVSDHEFHTFVSEIASVFRMCRPKKITLIQFDTEIKSIDEVKNIPELMKIKFHGRGGTDIGELIEWTNSNKPKLLMVFTDGDFRFNDYFTRREVLWMIHNNKRFQPPFGKAIHYDI